MKKSFLFLTLLILILTETKGQIPLIGATNTQTPGKIDIVTWRLFDSTSVVYYPTNLNAFALATSGFSDYSGDYFLSGISNSGMGRLSFNANSFSQSFINQTTTSNITEFDMSTGRMYKLVIDTTKRVSVLTHDVAQNKDSVIGGFQAPTLKGLLVDAICFDANHGIIYHLGINQDESADLYAIYCRDTSFAYAKTAISNPLNHTFSALNYDNVNNKIYARRGNFDSNRNYLGSDIIEIVPTTGNIIAKVAINQFPFFAASSSCFDQKTGTFMIIGATNSLNRQMIAYNTLTDSLSIGYVPEGVTEIACNNTSFAQLKYGTPTQVPSIKGLETVKIFPNPAKDRVSISIDPNTFNKNTKFVVINLLGETVFSINLEQAVTEININMLSKGIYFYQLENSQQRLHLEKLVVE